MADDLGAHGEGGIAALLDDAGEVDARDERVEARDPALGRTGEAVLVVDTRPVDAHEQVALTEVDDGDISDAAGPLAVDVADEEGAGVCVAHHVSNVRQRGRGG